MARRVTAAYTTGVRCNVGLGLTVVPPSRSVKEPDVFVKATLLGALRGGGGMKGQAGLGGESEATRAV